MGAKIKDMVGQVFGRLTVIGGKGKNKHGWYIWECQCSCGKTTSVAGPYLRSGNTRSCGCLKKEVVSSGANLKHGMEGSPTWHSWAGMIQRCSNPHHPRYSDYGGRGVTVCESWRKFENFYADMGVKPENKSLDRREVNGNYEPSNCRWATRLEQANNCRYNVILTINGESMTQAEWSRRYGIDQRTISARIRGLGWSPLKAVTTPKRIFTKNDS